MKIPIRFKNKDQKHAGTKSSFDIPNAFKFSVFSVVQKKIL